jgi:hypothetical protein
MTALADYVSRNSNGDRWQLWPPACMTGLYGKTPRSTPVRIQPVALAHDMRRLYGDKPRCLMALL